MRILLFFNRPTLDLTFYSNFLPPLGVAGLASALEQAGHEVRILDYAYTSVEAFAGEIERFRPAIVGVSTDSPSFGNERPYTREVRARLPRTTIVAGGPHPTVLPEHALEGNPDFDFLVIGEGEETLADLAACLARGGDTGSVAGLAFRENGGVRFTAPRTPLEDLDRYPPPARHLLPMERYLSSPPDLPLPARTTGILVSRGCPGNCAYCQPILKKLYGPGVKFRSVGGVVAEMDEVSRRYRTTSFCFNDAEPLLGGRDWMMEFSGALARRGAPYRWACQLRVDGLDREVLRAMKAGGCFSLSFGVETGSPKILKAMRKGYSAEDVRRAFALCREEGVIATANFMLGYPGETRETIEETFDLMEEIDPDLIRVTVATPVPGTHMFDALEREGRVNLKDWRDCDAKCTDPIRLEHLAVDEVEDAVRRFVAAYKRRLVRHAASPREAWRRRYFFGAVARHFAGVARSPRQLGRDLSYYLLYGFWHSRRRVRTSPRGDDAASP